MTAAIFYIIFYIILVLRFSLWPAKKLPVRYIFYKYIGQKRFFKEKGGTLYSRRVPPFYSTKFYVKRQNLIYYHFSFLIKQHTHFAAFVWQPYIAQYP